MKRFICLLLIVLCVASPVLAKTHTKKHAEAELPPVSGIATYDVYVGGVHLIQAESYFEEKNGKYHARVNAHTYGFWYRMLPWDSVLEVRGKLKNNKFTPVEFFTRDEWDHKPKITKLHFKKNGDVNPEFDPPSHDENREIVTQKMRHGSLDPVSALFQLLAHVDAEKSCNTTVPVFDGKRRFDITGTDFGTEYVDEEDYGIFKGDARVCDAGFTMIAGEWKDRKPSKFWQKSETEDGRDPFHIYLAPVGPGGKELAIRLESSSVFGLIIGHLSKWEFAPPEELK